MITSETWSTLTHAQKSLLIDKVLDTIQTIHSAGLAWRSTSSKHFYPSWDANKLWNVWLIDCEGVHKGTNLKSYQQNYKKLIKSMKIAGVENEILKELESKASILQTNLGILTKAA